MFKYTYLYFLLFACLFSEEPLAVYLTVGTDPLHSMGIHWITPMEVEEDLLYIRKKEEGHWMQVEGAHVPMPKKGPYLIHQVEVISLEANSPYEFKVDEKVYSFKTLPSSLPITFADGGDIYTESIAQVKTMNAQVASYSPSFAIFGGDIVYHLLHREMDKPYLTWLRFLTAYTESFVTKEGFLIPIIPVIGNHDAELKGNTWEKAILFYTLFALHPDQGYRVIDLDSYISLFILDTGHTHPIQGEQKNWLKTVLEERKEVPFKFASYHIPAYPCHRDPMKGDQKRVRETFTPLFQENGVILAFEHHDHLYKRTLDIGGVVYVGTGGWGCMRNIHEPKERSYLEKNLHTTGVALVTVNKSGVDCLVVDRDGKIIDEFTR